MSRWRSQAWKDWIWMQVEFCHRGMYKLKGVTDIQDVVQINSVNFSKRTFPMKAATGKAELVSSHFDGKHWLLACLWLSCDGIHISWITFPLLCVRNKLHCSVNSQCLWQMCCAEMWDDCHEQIRSELGIDITMLCELNKSMKGSSFQEHWHDDVWSVSSAYLTCALMRTWFVKVHQRLAKKRGQHSLSRVLSQVAPGRGLLYTGKSCGLQCTLQLV